MKQFSILFLFAFIGVLVLSVQACDWDQAKNRECQTPSGCTVKFSGDCCATNDGFQCCYPNLIGPDNYCYQ